MPTTPNLSLPYPLETDTADVPRDIQALAVKLDSLGAAVTSLPASPVDGQSCYYVASAANGVIWHLRYRAASTSPYKWEFVGGSPLSSGPQGNTTITSTTFVGFAGGPAVTLPLAGDYETMFGSLSQMQVAGQVNANTAISKNGVAFGLAATVYPTAQWGGGAVTLAQVNTYAASDALTLGVSVTGGLSTQFTEGWIRAQPRRVG